MASVLPLPSIDLFNQKLYGIATIDGTVTRGRKFGINFHGSVVKKVLVNDKEAKYTYFDTVNALASLPLLDQGLELFTVAHSSLSSSSSSYATTMATAPNASHDGSASTDPSSTPSTDTDLLNNGELTVTLPSTLSVPDDTVNHGTPIQVTIHYEIHGNNGPLRFAPSSTLIQTSSSSSPQPLHYVFTTLRPDTGYPSHSSSSSIHNYRPSCIFPCIDNPHNRCTFDLSIRILHTDSNGRIQDTNTKEMYENITVIGSGDDQTVSSLSSSEIFSPSSTNTTNKEYRFGSKFPVTVSSIGFVAGPLMVSETIDFRHTIHTKGTGTAMTTGTSAPVTSTSSSSASSASHSFRNPSRLGPSNSSATNASDNSTITSSSSVSHTATASIDRYKTTLSYYASVPKINDGSLTSHTRRTRRMMAWCTDYLRVRYPFNAHRWIFLPSNILPPCNAIETTSLTGLSTAGSGTGIVGEIYHGDALQDTYTMAGLTILSDSLLTSSRIIDADASTHRAQAYGLLATWFHSGLLSSLSSADSWLTIGIVRYLTLLYLRSFRGEMEYELEIYRTNEILAKLEEEIPSLLPLQSSVPIFPLAIDQPLRERYVNLKAPLVCHILSTHIEEIHFREALIACLAQTVPDLFDEIVRQSFRIQTQRLPSLDMVRSTTADSTAFGTASNETNKVGTVTLPSSLIAAYNAASSVLTQGITTTGFFTILKAITGNHPRINTILESLHRTWISTKGVPHFLVGTEYVHSKNAVHVVIEQVLRPGTPIFKGLMLIHVYERRENSNQRDIWAYTINITKIRESFTINCHNIMNRNGSMIPGVRLPKKRGRPPKLSEAMRAQAALANSNAARTAHEAKKVDRRRKGNNNQKEDTLDPDEFNVTPVEYIRIDPLQGWIKRVHTVMPPSMAIAQLVKETSLVGQMEALRCLAEAYAPDTIAVPGTIVPVPKDSAVFPLLSVEPIDSQDPFSSDIEHILKLDTKASRNLLGYHLRAQNMLTPLLRMGAVVAGVNARYSRTIRTGTASAKLSGTKGNTAETSTSGTTDATLATSSSSSSLTTIDQKSLDLIYLASRDDVYTDYLTSSHWLVRLSSAYFICRWAGAHLPPYGKPVNSYTTFAGVAGVIALYQRLFYQTTAPLPPSARAYLVSVAAAAAASATMIIASASNDEQGNENSSSSTPALEFTSTDLTGAFGNHGPLTPAGVSLLLTAMGQCTEEEVLEFARGGVPGPVTVTSLSHYHLRHAFLTAITSIRHPDNYIPDAVLAFSTLNLREYDSHIVNETMDDAPLLSNLILSLGFGLMQSDGARRVLRILRQHHRRETTEEMNKDNHHHETNDIAAVNGTGSSGTVRGHQGSVSSPSASSKDPWSAFLPADPTGTLNYVSVQLYKDAWSVLREQLALEATSLRYFGEKANASFPPTGLSPTVVVHPSLSAPSSPAFLSSEPATNGLVLSAIISVLTVLETRLSAPVTVLPLLRGYLSRYHPLGQYKIPSRVRIAAFAALCRELLINPPITSSNETDHTHGFPLWLQSLSSLLSVIHRTVKEEGIEGEAIGRAFTNILYHLQARTDRAGDVNKKSDSIKTNHDDSSSSSSASSSFVDAFVIERLQNDLHRAMVTAENIQEDLQAIIQGTATEDLSHGSKIYRTKWTFTEAAVDLGIFDCNEEYMSLQERRIYGPLRYAPAYRGCFSPLMDLYGDPTADRIRTNANELVTVTKKFYGLIPLLGNYGYHTVHSIFGMGPPLAYRYGKEGSSATRTVGTGKKGTNKSANGTKGSNEYAEDIDNLTDHRRELLQYLRNGIRVTHLQAAVSYANAKALQQQTGTAEAVDEDEDEDMQDLPALENEPDETMGDDDEQEEYDDEEEEEEGEEEDDEGEDEEEGETSYSYGGGNAKRNRSDGGGRNLVLRLTR